jgi:hypothetical protein
MHEFRVDYSECSFSEYVRLREHSLSTSHAGNRPSRALLCLDYGVAAEFRARANVPARADRPAWENNPINALITNRFPEFTQPTIEWPLQRTFGEHGDPASRSCTNSVWILRMLVF